jgi:cellulose synthase/poly-beta-1,6-N-acetylglucosamine synthase-like glycosyltransferase
MIVLELLFWISAAGVAWTHVGYPLAAAGLARLRGRRAEPGPSALPSVTIVVAAHDEESVIARRLDNLLALDYPPELVAIVVASDASGDETDAIVAGYAERAPQVRLLACPRGGKVAAQNRAVAATESELVAFTDANATWAPDALRWLVRQFADPAVAYVCGRLVLEDAQGGNREGLYWRYELWLRESESRLYSITGGNGSIYAVRRDAYADVDPRFGHDLSFPYLMVQRGFRALYEPAAKAFERPTPTNETEYRRKVRMFEHCWLIALRGRMLRRLPVVYWLEVFSHRTLRYATGILHLVMLATSAALASGSWLYAGLLVLQLALVAAAVAGVGIARYYVLVTLATVIALVNYLRRGVPATWEPAEGTR